eukprot:NODE_2932_length_1457_cov_49.453523_g2539_i0.p1 GENE.NODE_2932_length_1457_cov_49.453523_g2539_i0~~NODE_2932_length_1457_cov_49.453523_g2539_i0.p1  ORF type:complete len:416 (+),score=89.95 NODE_2932_length_1457_cov_49.453523_g2539_i0:156-1403(+)
MQGRSSVSPTQQLVVRSDSPGKYLVAIPSPSGPSLTYEVEIQGSPTHQSSPMSVVSGSLMTWRNDHERHLSIDGEESLKEEISKLKSMLVEQERERHIQGLEMERLKQRLDQVSSDCYAAVEELKKAVSPQYVKTPVHTMSPTLRPSNDWELLYLQLRLVQAEEADSRNNIRQQERAEGLALYRNMLDTALDGPSNITLPPPSSMLMPEIREWLKRKAEQAPSTTSPSWRNVPLRPFTILNQSPRPISPSPIHPGRISTPNSTNNKPQSPSSGSMRVGSTSPSWPGAYNRLQRWLSPPSSYQQHRSYVFPSDSDRSPQENLYINEYPPPIQNNSRWSTPPSRRYANVNPTIFQPTIPTYHPTPTNPHSSYSSPRRSIPLQHPYEHNNSNFQAFSHQSMNLLEMVPPFSTSSSHWC